MGRNRLHMKNFGTGNAGPDGRRGLEYTAASGGVVSRFLEKRN